MAYEWKITPETETALAKTMKLFDFNSPEEYALMMKGQFICEAIPLAAKRLRKEVDELTLSYQQRITSYCDGKGWCPNQAYQEISRAAQNLLLS